MEVIRLQATDCKELVSFLDEVFTLQNGRPMDFLALFPRIFCEEDSHMNCYYAVKEDGKIIGTAASHPLFYRVGETTLKISAGGNVAVSPACRNRGIMQCLLHRINEDLAKEDFDLVYLHGDRKRYRTFGFERCGTEYLFSFTRSMLEKEGVTADVTLTDLREESPDVQEKALLLSLDTFSGVNRPQEDFLPSLIARSATPLAIQRKGELIGYLSLVKSTVYELVLKDAADLGPALLAVMEYASLTKPLSLSLPSYEWELVRRAVTLTERYTLLQPGNFQIIHFDRVVTAFLQAKSLYAPLENGSLTLDTDLFGTWCLSVKDKTVTVTPYTGKADLTLTGTRVYEFLFGPCPPFLTEASSALPPEKARLCANWFPLPLYCPPIS